MKSKILATCFGLLISTAAASGAHADKWRVDTDGLLGKNEYRNPRIEYYGDYRDYDKRYPRAYQVKYNNWDRSDNRWRDNRRDWNRDCDRHGARPIRYNYGHDYNDRNYQNDHDYRWFGNWVR